MESRSTRRLALRLAVAAAFGLALIGTAAPASAASSKAPATTYSDGSASGDVQTLGLIWT
jgi:phosphodiesterase/alkaline phosphatase D-like protein